MLQIVMAAAAVLARLHGMPSHGAELTMVERAAVSAIVGDQLKDAQSAEYKWPALSAPFMAAQAGSYCGWVNSKNSYGGYVGYRQFMVIGAINIRNGRFEANGKAEIVADDEGGFDKIVTNGCSEDGYDTSGPPPSR